MIFKGNIASSCERSCIAILTGLEFLCNCTKATGFPSVCVRPLRLNGPEFVMDRTTPFFSIFSLFYFTVSFPLFRLHSLLLPSHVIHSLRSGFSLFCPSFSLLLSPEDFINFLSIYVPISLLSPNLSVFSFFFSLLILVSFACFLSLLHSFLIFLAVTLLLIFILFPFFFCYSSFSFYFSFLYSSSSYSSSSKGNICWWHVDFQKRVMYCTGDGEGGGEGKGEGVERPHRGRREGVRVRPHFIRGFRAFQKRIKHKGIYAVQSSIIYQCGTPD